jgi:2-iminobutanoate/2-iminopropanoate deaminase
MLMKIATEQAPKPAGPYSQAMWAGDYIFVSGQGPIDSDGNIIRGTIDEQTRLTLDNIQNILSAAGASLKNAVRVSAHLSELNQGNFASYNKVYSEYFKEPFPARITVGSQLLGIDVEIEVIAYIGK